MIRAEHIFKSFDGRTVLDDISVEFETGKTNLIIGQSGSGKTVLLSITAGAPEAAYQRDGFTGHTVFELLTPLAVTAKVCSMIFAEPVVSYGYSVPAAQNDKENYLANARKHAQALSAQLKAL